MEDHMIPVTMKKKIWKLVQVFLLMARKGISSKRKVMLDINLLLKKGKIAGKALVGSLIFHHHKQYPSSAAGRALYTKNGEYEFSCSETPAHHAMFNFIHHHLHVSRKKHKKGKKARNNKNVEVNEERIECPEFFIDEESFEAVSRVLETLAEDAAVGEAGSSSSLSSFSSLNYPVSHYSTPAYSLPGLGFGRSPQIKQLRVTDSPYPLVNSNSMEYDRHVDEAAEAFINRFYSQLRQQRLTPGPHGADC